MKNPKAFSTFLGGFNVGTFLSLISLFDILMSRLSFGEYIVVLTMILTNGVVIGIVLQYLLIHTNLTKNMGKAFYYAGDDIPKRLLEMRGNEVEKTLELLVGISSRVKVNLMVMSILIILLVLTLLLPIFYSYKCYSKMFLFNIGWSSILLILILRLVIVTWTNSQYIRKKISKLLDAHQFNPVQLKNKEG